MTQVNMPDAKTNLSKLIRMLGTKQEGAIYLAKNGTAVVQMTLIPVKQSENGLHSRKAPETGPFAALIHTSDIFQSGIHVVFSHRS